MATCPSCGRESADDFAFCPFCGAALTAAPPEAAAEVRKTVTVVFCDVTGSTSLGERLDPETLRGVMARYFDEMERAVERHGGTVEKFIGDAVMAVFGIPELHEDDALRAVRAAADMRDAMQWLNKELERDHGVTLAARIGVNTGEVVARQDAEAGAQRLVTGDAVNVAARLQQAAEPGEIVIGDASHRLVRDAVEAVPTGPLDLKGKELPVAAFRLELVHPHAEGVARRFDSPMVGRARQLRQLEEAYRTAVDERASYLFTVLGAPGVGKSRLTEEFLRSVASEATVLRGRCLSYGQGITFFPVSEILTQAAGLDELEAPEESRRRIVEVLGGGEEAAVVADRLLLLTGAAETAAGTEELFWAVRYLLESLARQRPLVVVIDDIHWAEPTLLDLIEHVADWSRDAPILLVCPARPELLDVRHGWGGGKVNASMILLEPLSEEECDELVANLLGRAGLDEAARHRIASAAEGNPLFVEQMLAMLVDDGLLAERDSRWEATGDLADVAVPPTVSALLSARLDRLGREERRVIERAAVEGKVFHAGAVAALLDDGEADLSDHLKTLVRRELVRPHGGQLPGQQAYRFRHQLIRDTAYESIPKRTRADLHRRFASWLSDAAGERSGEFAEFVGYHLEQSYRLRAELGPVDEAGRDDGRRAGTLLAESGIRAMGRNDAAAAANLLTRAVALLPRPDVLQVHAARELAESLTNLSEFRRATEVLDEALEDARRLGDQTEELLLELKRSTVVQMFDPSHSYLEQERLGHRAVQQFEAAGNWAAAATAWDVIAFAQWGAAHWNAMRDSLGRAAEHARRAGDRERELGFLQTRLTAMYFGDGRSSEGVRLARELVEQTVGRPFLHARVTDFLGRFLAMRGEFDEAWACLEVARTTYERLGGTSWIATIGFGSGPVAMATGRLDVLEADYRRGLSILGRSGERGWSATIAGDLAWILLRQGRAQEAEEFLAIAQETALPEDTNAEALWRIVKAVLLSVRGEHDEAIRMAHGALEANARTDELNFRADWFRALSEILERAGRGEEAVAAAREALDFYERKENLVGAAAMRERLNALGA